MDDLIGLLLITLGGNLIYAGIKNKSALAVFKGAAAGQPASSVPTSSGGPPTPPLLVGPGINANPNQIQLGVDPQLLGPGMANLGAARGGNTTPGTPAPRQGS